MIEAQRSTDEEERNKKNEYELFVNSKEKVKKNKIFDFLKKPFLWIRQQFEKVGDFLSFQFQPKEIKKELLASAYREAEEEYKKEKDKQFCENIEVSNKKMAIIRDEELTNEDKLKQLSNLCYDSGRTYTAATQRGAYMFEKEANTVRIMYAEKKYRTLEEKEQGIARYSFSNAAIGGIVYTDKGKQTKEDYGLFDAVNRMSNERDSFDFSTRGLDGILETEGRIIAEKNVETVEIANTNEENIKLDKAIMTGNRQEIKNELKEHLTKAQIEEEKFKKLPNYYEGELEQAEQLEQIEKKSIEYLLQEANDKICEKNVSRTVSYDRYEDEEVEL